MFFQLFKVCLRGRCCKIRYRPLAVHAAERSCDSDSDLKLGWRKCRKISKLSNLWKHDKLIHLLFFKSVVKWEKKNLHGIITEYASLSKAKLLCLQACIPSLLSIRKAIETYHTLSLTSLERENKKVCIVKNGPWR